MNRFSKLCALCASLFVSTMSYAQSSLLATLSHEGNITSYYGTNALKEAVTAAANGDVITLSSGQFNAVDINKAITVRGAGMAADPISGNQPTVITGNFSLKAPTEATTANLILEGLYHNHTIYYYNGIKNAQIIKCRFNNFEYSNTVSVSFSFIQCRVNGKLDLASNSSMTCVNSYIHSPHCANYTTSNFDMQNCVIFFDANLFSSFFNNCILVPNSNSSNANGGVLDGSNMAYNSIAVGTTLYAAGVFKNIPNTTNKQVAGYEMFKTFKGTWNDDADFILTEEAVKTYLGTDGSQVGLYGGPMPYETTPNNPQITKFNVASKSTADGKLSVDIQVGVAE